MLAGGSGKELQVVETEITADIVNLARVDSNGETWLAVGCGLTHQNELEKSSTYAPVVNLEVGSNYSHSEPKIEKVKESFCFDSVQTAESLIAWEKARIAKLATREMELQPELEKALVEYRARVEKEEKDKEERKAESEKRSAAIEASNIKRDEEKKQREQEKRDWILKHGSQYLKDCLELNVKANKEYVFERAGIEFPGYVVDYSDDARWDDKVSPSKEALKELKGLRAKKVESEIVWLKDRYFTESNDYDNNPTPCEAVMIHNYLGKYDLVKIM